MPSWKDFDLEQRKKSDEIFLQVARNRNMIKGETLDAALRQQKEMMADGQFLAIGQVLLKMRALNIETFMKINQLAKEETMICDACGTVHHQEEGGHSRGKCHICGMDLHQKMSSLTATNDSTPWIMGCYEILHKIARGGMGVVYRARHLESEQIVALKVLHQDLEDNFQITRRFRREWKLSSSLNHDHIVKVFDAGVLDGKHFFTMEYIDGSPLNELLKNGPLPPEKALGIIRKLALALDYAHESGIIHRDIKPANIIINQDFHPYITDFGIAKAIDSTTQLTRTGMAVGTLFYMAPEQALGENQLVDNRSDIYSLGVVLYEMLSGGRPFDGETYMEVLVKIKDQPPPPLVGNIENLNPQIEKICFKALAKTQSRRYVTAGELVEDIDRYLGGEVTQAEIDVAAMRPSFFSTCNLLKLTYLVLAVIAITVGGVYISWGTGTPKPPVKQGNGDGKYGQKPPVSETKDDSKKDGKTKIAKDKNKNPALPGKPEKAPPVDEIKVRQYMITGASFLRTRDYVRARGYFTKAIEMFKPQRPPRLFFLRGVTHQLMGRRLEARQDYTKSISGDGKFGMAYYARASLLTQIGQNEEALKDYRKAAALHPHFVIDSGNIIEGLLQWDRDIRRRPIYWSWKTQRIYFVGKGPEYDGPKVFQKTTDHFYWKVSYRPLYEVEWTFDAAEKVYRILVKKLGIKPGVPRIAVFISSSSKQRIVGYSEGQRLPEIRYYASNWRPRQGCLEVVIQTIASQFLFTGISPDWPYDWWATDFTAFHALLVVDVLKELGYPELAQRKYNQHITQAQFRLMKKWTDRYGWKGWRRFFQTLQRDQVNFYGMAKRGDWKTRSSYIAAYLQLVFSQEKVVSQLVRAGVGKRPNWWDRKWPSRRFDPYQLESRDVEEILAVRKDLLEYTKRYPSEEDWPMALDEIWDQYRSGKYSRVKVALDTLKKKTK